MTFWTTTAAFRAEKALMDKVVNCDFKLVAVPVELAETCHGYGLQFTLGAREQLGEAEEILKDAGVEWKAEWASARLFSQGSSDSSSSEACLRLSISLSSPWNKQVPP